MKLLIIILLVLCNSLIIRPQDDTVYYAKITNTRTYMNIDRVSVTEYWFSKEKTCILTNQEKTIIRKDLGTTYFIDLRAGTYKTNPITPQPVVLSYEEITDLKYAGQYYYPQFEWNKPQLLLTDTLCGRICEHYLCEGDADFAQISLEYFVAKTDDQLIAGCLNSTIMSLSRSGNRREPIAGLLAGNKNLITLRITESLENSIAPQITTTINVDCLDRVKSSAGLFELPANVKKSN